MSNDFGEILTGYFDLFPFFIRTKERESGYLFFLPKNGNKRPTIVFLLTKSSGARRIYNIIWYIEEVMRARDARISPSTDGIALALAFVLGI